MPSWLRAAALGAASAAAAFLVTEALTRGHAALTDALEARAWRAVGRIRDDWQLEKAVERDYPQVLWQAYEATEEAASHDHD
jgi:hypothetical protein